MLYIGLFSNKFELPWATSVYLIYSTNCRLELLCKMGFFLLRRVMFQISIAVKMLMNADEMPEDKMSQF